MWKESPWVTWMVKVRAFPRIVILSISELSSQSDLLRCSLVPRSMLAAGFRQTVHVINETMTASTAGKG